MSDMVNFCEHCDGYGFVQTEPKKVIRPDTGEDTGHLSFLYLDCPKCDGENTRNG